MFLSKIINSGNYVLDNSTTGNRIRFKKGTRVTLGAVEGQYAHVQLLESSTCTESGRVRKKGYGFSVSLQDIRTVKIPSIENFLKVCIKYLPVDKRFPELAERSKLSSQSYLVIDAKTSEVTFSLGSLLRLGIEDSKKDRFISIYQVEQAEQRGGSMVLTGSYDSGDIALDGEGKVVDETFCQILADWFKECQEHLQHEKDLRLVFKILPQKTLLDTKGLAYTLDYCRYYTGILNSGKLLKTKHKKEPTNDRLGSSFHRRSIEEIVRDYVGEEVHTITNVAPNPTRRRRPNGNSLVGTLTTDAFELDETSF